MDSKKLTDCIVAALEDRKGKKIEVIDIHKVSVLADCFVICSGTSTTHLRGMADEVLFRLEKEGVKCQHTEGYDTASWILLDFTDVVVHLFLEEERAYYNIERLWRTGGVYRPDTRPEKAEPADAEKDGDGESGDGSEAT